VIALARKRIAAACLIVATAAHFRTGSAAFAQQIESGSPNTRPAIQYRKLPGQSPVPTLHLVVFDSARYSLRVIDNGAKQPLPKAMQGENCIAGINGGFFDPATLAPSGMMISKGRTFVPFDGKAWQEGVLFVHEGQIELVSRDQFNPSRSATHALQSSPWLIRFARIMPEHIHHTRRSRRSFVAKGKSGLCAIGCSTPATFQALAETLTSDQFRADFDIIDALAMDGASSSGFWSNVDGIEVSEPETATVRNFLGVVPIDQAEIGIFRTKRSLWIIGLAVFLLIIAVAFTRYARSRDTRAHKSSPR
jgi:uncharacterized protein YigE (DUF2233 family)